MNAQVNASQFFLGPDLPEVGIGWQRFELAPGLCLAAHPDLSVSRIENGGRSLTLIGFILDPDEPDATDMQILGRLLSRFGGIDALLGATTRLGGRWILIAVDKERRWLFHDALGLRQVFHTDRAETGSLYVMSQPGLAREALGLAIDDSARRYMESQAFRCNSEYRWPGVATPFQGLRHLLPNHVLDLATGSATRYWPVTPLAAIDVECAVEDIAQLMQGLIRAAAKRFDLALSLTAGWDSRLVLAAARSVKDQLTYVTVRQARMPDGHADIEVPARLLRSLRLPHTIVPAAPGMTAEFAYAFKRSVFLSHEHYGADAEAILKRFNRTKVALVGSGGEIGRCYTRISPLRKLATPIEVALARAEIGEAHEFAVHHYREWLSALSAQRKAINVCDLFEWEQGHGNWVAMTEMEFDIAWRDILSPFNCRAVLTAMLSVDERMRKPPRYVLFETLIRRLWPEVLAAPINPHRGFSWTRSVSPQRLIAFGRSHWLEALLAAAAGGAVTALVMSE